MYRIYNILSVLGLSFYVISQLKLLSSTFPVGHTSSRSRKSLPCSINLVHFFPMNNMLSKFYLAKDPWIGLTKAKAVTCFANLKETVSIMANLIYFKISNFVTACPKMYECSNAIKLLISLISFQRCIQCGARNMKFFYRRFASVSKMYTLPGWTRSGATLKIY